LGALVFWGKLFLILACRLLSAGHAGRSGSALFSKKQLALQSARGKSQLTPNQDSTKKQVQTKIFGSIDIFI
jgi:hypothetical protein